jgi:hypothetical protein
METLLMGQIEGKVIPPTVHFDSCGANRFCANRFKSESEIRQAFAAIAFSAVRQSIHPCQYTNNFHHCRQLLTLSRGIEVRVHKFIYFFIYLLI